MLQINRMMKLSKIIRETLKVCINMKKIVSFWHFENIAFVLELFVSPSYTVNISSSIWPYKEAQNLQRTFAEFL